MDACGVCEGDNSTCAGCDGLVDTEKIYDFCGECLLPDDTLFNKTCITLSKFSPTTSPVAGGRVILVEGERIDNHTVARCAFSHEVGDRFAAEEVEIGEFFAKQYLIRVLHLHYNIHISYFLVLGSDYEA